MTVLEASALESLVLDTGSRDFVLDLVARFRRMLDGRIGRIREALSASDVEQAMDAVLSLRTSASMLGARDLVIGALKVEQQVREFALTGARGDADRLPDLAAATDDALARWAEGRPAQATTVRGVLAPS